MKQAEPRLRGSDVLKSSHYSDFTVFRNGQSMGTLADLRISFQKWLEHLEEEAVAAGRPLRWKKPKPKPKPSAELE